ncbi:MAG: hypothetical protein HQK57_02375 [Deltaproteobacteria bacterium]|nr:hypothetical protein [Deltaproteobacteria bacterium]
MAKKTYTPPRVVDLSLENLTGIGATACNSGGNANNSADCDLFGNGASNSCNRGNATGGSCSTQGYGPSFAGGFCAVGPSPVTSTHGFCGPGSGTTGAGDLCATGNSAVYSSSNCVAGGGDSSSNTCEDGGANAWCIFGTTQSGVS